MRQRSKSVFDVADHYHSVMDKLKKCTENSGLFWQPPSYLQLRSRAKRTIAQYLEEVGHYCDRILESNEFPKSANDIDHDIVSFFEQEYDRGRSKGRPANLQAALQLLLPALKGNLIRSSAASKSFDELSPAESNEPFPKFLMGHFVLGECVAGRVEHAEMAVVYMETFARKEELGSLPANRYQATDDKSGYSIKATIDLPHDPSQNTRQKTKKSQHIIVNDRVAEILNGRKTEARNVHRKLLFGVTPGQLTYRMKQFCTLHNIGDRKIGLHSLRHAAAVNMHLMGVSDEDIREQGRWGSLKNMKIYLSRTCSMLITMNDLFSEDFRNEGYDLFERRFDILRTFRVQASSRASSVLR